MTNILDFLERIDRIHKALWSFIISLGLYFYIINFKKIGDRNIPDIFETLAKTLEIKVYAVYSATYIIFFIIIYLVVCYILKVINFFSQPYIEKKRHKKNIQNLTTTEKFVLCNIFQKVSRGDSVRYDYYHNILQGALNDLVRKNILQCREPIESRRAYNNKDDYWINNHIHDLLSAKNQKFFQEIYKSIPPETGKNLSKQENEELPMPIVFRDSTYIDL